jgi:hypothetical protein
MSKLFFLVIASASMLIFASCNNSTTESTDLELVSKNLENAFQRNQESAVMISTDIKLYMVENTTLIAEKKEKLTNTLEKISSLEKEEQKLLKSIENQVANNNQDIKIELDKVIASSSEFYASVLSNIKETGESKDILNQIKSDLDFTKYKLEGTKMEKTLGLNSIKLSVSHAYYLSVFHLRNLISLE